jgi:alpha-beta hydrolase superfamily lysophospholipase
MQTSGPLAFMSRRPKQSDHPSSTQVVIAHSHGGNVALRALDQLGVTRNEIFIATIATPFVEILRTKLSPEARVDVMVSATTAILVPQYVVHARYTFSPR